MRFHIIWLLYHGYIRVITHLLSQAGLIYEFKAESTLRDCGIIRLWRSMHGPSLACMNGGSNDDVL